MKLRFLYATLLLAIATVKAEGDVVGAGNAVGNNDLGIIMKRNDPGNRGRSINDADDHSGNEKFNTILENNNLDGNQGTSTTDPSSPFIDNSSTDSSTSSTTTSSTSSTITSPTSSTTTSPTPSDTTSSTSSTTTSPTSSTTTSSTSSTITSPTPSNTTSPTPSNTTSSTPSNTTSSTPSNTTSTPGSDLPSTEDYPYQVKGENGTACILSKMSISLIVTYNTTNNNTNVEKTLTVPNNATVDGECNDTISKMTLIWPSVSSYYVDESINFEDANNWIEFNFNKSESKSWLQKITGVIHLDSHNFPNATDDSVNLAIEQDLFIADMGSKYVCNVEFVIKSSDRINLAIKVESLITFNDDNNVSSKSESKCPGYLESSESIDSADVGAIVGGIIGAAAVIGIVGFVIWRRRRNNSPVRSEVA